MDERLVILGSVLLLIGLFGYTYADMRLNEYSDFGSQLERAFDEGEQQNYRNWGLIKSAGAAVTPVGLILAIAGLIKDYRPRS